VTNQDDITLQDLELVRLSFERCKAQAEFSDIFYDNLAQQSSEIGPLFAETDMVKQNQLLRVGIESLIEFSAGEADVEVEIRRLGVLHDRQHHATRPELYPLWINALVATVDETDSDATPEITAAWRRVVAPGIALISSYY
jgi:hemoglobin-like flavoprotein